MIKAEDILSLAERYAELEHVALSTVSSRVFGDGKKLDAIRYRDADLTLKRAAAAIDWFAANWPKDAEWPRGVSRPFAANEDAAA